MCEEDCDEECVSAYVGSNEAVLSKYPKISGYPHLLVLDKGGNLLRSQDTSELEDGRKSYDKKKFTAFLKQWAPPGK